MAYTDTVRSTQLYTLLAYRSVVYSVLLYPLPVHSQNNDPQRSTETNKSLRFDIVYLYISQQTVGFRADSDKPSGCFISTCYP